MKFKFEYLNFSFIIIFNNITFISLSLDSGQHSTHIPLLLWLKELLASCPVVDSAILLFIRCRHEELGKFLDTGRPYVSMQLFLNVL